MNKKIIAFILGFLLMIPLSAQIRVNFNGVPLNYKTNNTVYSYNKSSDDVWRYVAVGAITVVYYGSIIYATYYFTKNNPNR